ncbi:hypothetical protein BDB13_3575 [Rhodococcus sp. OK302]|nr:hypothetical protein BDB13_3575 [Rhodococcus sp. OK302]
MEVSGECPGGGDQSVAARAAPGSGVEISLTVTLEMVDIVESIDLFVD